MTRLVLNIFQVQIAPVHAQAQAQQVQEAAAQQAAQHIVTSKPLPLTVSVSGLVSGTMKLLHHQIEGTQLCKSKCGVNER